MSPPLSRRVGRSVCSGIQSSTGRVSLGHVEDHLFKLDRVHLCTTLSSWKDLIRRETYL